MGGPLIGVQQAGDSEQPSMAELLEAAEPVRELRRGQVVDGEVVRVDQDGILVSIGHKSEGIIPLREARSLTHEELDRYQPGTTVWAYVLEMAGEEGQVVLSLDRARGEAAWRLLEQCHEDGSDVAARITGVNRGGAVVDVSGAQGFVPFSQLGTWSRRGGGNQEALEQRVGEEVMLRVLEVDRRRNRAVLSERAALEKQHEESKQRLFDTIEEGQVLQGRVSGTCNFGAFVDLGGADGLIHISELAWTPVANPEEVVKVGDEVGVYVLRVDRENRRIALSLRHLQSAPWDSVAERYEVGHLITGTVTKLVEFGAFVKVEEGVEGLVHVSELSDRHIHHPKEVVQPGDTLTLSVISLDPMRHRLGLSLKQVEADDVT